MNRALGKLKANEKKKKPQEKRINRSLAADLSRYFAAFICSAKRGQAERVTVIPRYRKKHNSAERLMLWPLD